MRRVLCVRRARRPRNPNLLYAGTERGLYISFDGGQNWQKMPNLPAVPVHDMVVHPIMNDLVVGTHAQCDVFDDITPPQEISSDILNKPAHLFTPPTAWRYSGRFCATGAATASTAPTPPQAP